MSEPDTEPDHLERHAFMFTVVDDGEVVEIDPEAEILDTKPTQDGRLVVWWKVPARDG